MYFMQGFSFCGDGWGLGRQSPLTSQKFVNLLITPTPPPLQPQPLTAIWKNLL